MGHLEINYKLKIVLYIFNILQPYAKMLYSGLLQKKDEKWKTDSWWAFTVISAETSCILPIESWGQLTREGSIQWGKNSVLSFRLQGGRQAKLSHHVTEETLRCAHKLHHLLCCKTRYTLITTLNDLDVISVTIHLYILIYTNVWHKDIQIKSGCTQWAGTESHLSQAWAPGRSDEWPHCWWQCPSSTPS